MIPRLGQKSKDITACVCNSQLFIETEDTKRREQNKDTRVLGRKWQNNDARSCSIDRRLNLTWNVTVVKIKKLGGIIRISLKADLTQGCF